MFRAFFDRLLAAMFGPIVPDSHPACPSRLDVWDGVGN
jgi:hypothetical protein